MKTQTAKKTLLLNILFVLACGAVLIFLLNAPEETTSPLPHDENHQRFYEIKGKKEAEKYCAECHEENKVAPLPADHPPKYRCLFCHKRT